MAGSSDCIMSFNRWQKLIAARMPNAVLAPTRDEAMDVP